MATWLLSITLWKTRRIEQRWSTLLGLIFVVVIMFMPYGLVPGCTQAWRRLRNRIKTGKAAGNAASELAQ